MKGLDLDLIDCLVDETLRSRAIDRLSDLAELEGEYEEEEIDFYSYFSKEDINWLMDIYLEDDNWLVKLFN